MTNTPQTKQPAEIEDALQQLEGWTRHEEDPAIQKTFTFSNFHETMAFVNALAWIAHTMDHHPDLKVSYKTCEVTFSTHSVGGVTDLDLEAARKANGLLSS